jgi:hypothetical protein
MIFNKMQKISSLNAKHTKQEQDGKCKKTVRFLSKTEGNANNVGMFPQGLRPNIGEINTAARKEQQEILCLWPPGGPHQDTAGCFPGY